MMKKVLFLLVFVFAAANLSAQQGRIAPATSEPQEQLEPQSIQHVDQFIAGLRAARGNSRAAAQQPLRVESLINDLQSATYLENGIVKTYGETPTCLFTDVRSLTMIGNLNVPVKGIEIVTIRIKNQSELNTMINTSVFANFPKLKYVYIISDVSVSPSVIIRNVQNNNPKLNVFYNIVKQG